MMAARIIQLFTLCGWVNKLIAQEHFTSDACHGDYLPQCTNILSCAKPSLTICILEVRSYQYNVAGGCDSVISRKTESRCCAHNDTACYKRMGKHNIDLLQEECASGAGIAGKCELVSETTPHVTPTCSTDNNGSEYSNIRSIIYTCVQGNCPSGSAMNPRNSVSTSSAGQASRYPSRTQAHQSVTTKMRTTKGETTMITTSETKPVTYHTTSSISGNQDEGKPNTRAVVGGVLGVIISIGIVAALIYFYRRRALPGAKGNIRRITDVRDAAESDMPRRRPSGSMNIGFNESVAQPEGTFDGQPRNTPDYNSISDLYSKVDKTGKPGKVIQETDSHGGYDHIPGESAHFSVNRQGDYDHVTVGGEAYSDEAANIDETIRADPSSHQDTYDKLHRFAPPTLKVADEDIYHRLQQTTADHPKGSNAHDHDSTSDDAIVPALAPPASFMTATIGLDGHNIYDLAQAFPDVAHF